MLNKGWADGGVEGSVDSAMVVDGWIWLMFNLWDWIEVMFLAFNLRVDQFWSWKQSLPPTHCIHDRVCKDHSCRCVCVVSSEISVAKWSICACLCVIESQFGYLHESKLIWCVYVCYLVVCFFYALLLLCKWLLCSFMPWWLPPPRPLRPPSSDDHPPSCLFNWQPLLIRS